MPDNINMTGNTTAADESGSYLDFTRCDNFDSLFLHISFDEIVRLKHQDPSDPYLGLLRAHLQEGLEVIQARKTRELEDQLHRLQLAGDHQPQIAELTEMLDASKIQQAAVQRKRDVDEVWTEGWLTTDPWSEEEAVRILRIFREFEEMEKHKRGEEAREKEKETGTEQGGFEHVTDEDMNI